MTKIGNTVPALFRPALIIFFFFAIYAPRLAAQDFSLEASVSESTVFTGEQFQLSVEVSGSSMRNVELPVLPQINGIRILSNTPSRSTSLSMVNGRTSASTTYTYTLIARNSGTFTIPPITITIDGEERQTQPLRIEVVEKGNLAQSGRQLPDIFLKIELDDNTPVRGQQIVASVALYFKQGIEVTSFQPTAGWRTDGFWKEELQNIRSPEAESVILEGMRYRRAILMRYALFPTRSGEHTLSEFSLSAGIRTQSSRNDPFSSFFGGGINQRRISMESDPVTVSVEPLPEPENALSINAVGNLRVERSINKTDIVTGETVELKTVVSGTGSIPLIRQPDFTMPEGVDIYTPQETSNIERRGITIRGEKTFLELLAARAPGTYEIPVERIAIFDPSVNRYRYVRLAAIRFNVTPAPENQQMASNTSFSLTPVTGLTVWHTSQPIPLHKTGWFWVLLLLPAAILGAGYYYKLHRNRLSTDRIFARSHLALKTANERIEQARQAMNNQNHKEVYNCLYKAITGFISDKLALPEAGLPDKELIKRVQQREAPATVIKSLKGMLDKCATISYAPLGGADDQLADIKKTETLISELKGLL